MKSWASLLVLAFASTVIAAGPKVLVCNGYRIYDGIPAADTDHIVCGKVVVQVPDVDPDGEEEEVRLVIEYRHDDGDPWSPLLDETFLMTEDKLHLVKFCADHTVAVGPAFAGDSWEIRCSMSLTDMRNHSDWGFVLPPIAMPLPGDYTADDMGTVEQSVYGE